MKLEGLLFAFLAAFLVLVDVVYWALSGDPVGTTCLGLSGALSFIIGYYLLFTARRIGARPEDRADAEMSEGSGEVGFFAPHSWWPIVTAGSFALTTLGLVFGLFLFLIGVLFIVITASGFLFEYYVGINRTQSHTLGALEVMGEPPTSGNKFLGEQH